MPRDMRRVSMAGIYHVVVKGINGQDLFEEERDYRKFLEILKRCKKDDHFDIHAYCLMSNHAHLLIRLNDKNISEVMHRIGTIYGGWFNKKYERKGHLFQNRFFSEAVDNVYYFKVCWRYILQNPMRAGMEKFPGERYQWSSVHTYKGRGDGITEIHFIEKYFEGFSEMMAFLEGNGMDDRHKLRIMRGGRLPDETALYVMRKVCSCSSITEFQKLKKKERMEYVQLMHGRYNIPLKQICRITGISYRSVKKYCGV